MHERGFSQGNVLTLKEPTDCRQWKREVAASYSRHKLARAFGITLTILALAIAADQWASLAGLFAPSSCRSPSVVTARRVSERIMPAEEFHGISTRFIASLENIASELHQLRDVKAHGQTVLDALNFLAGREALGRQIWEVAKQSLAKARPRAAFGDLEAAEVIAELVGMQDTMASSLLNAVRQARAVAFSFPKAKGHLQAAQGCTPSLLAGIDAFARHVAEEAPGPNSEFAHGLYLSELCIADRSVTFFGASQGAASWARDAKGFHVPRDLVRAEAALWQGEQLSPPQEQAQRSITRAARLLAHARLLTSKRLDHAAAAHWRFLAAARLASSGGHQGLAAQSLAWLSHHLRLQGRHHDALQAASQALSHADEPLALLLQASLRRSLGQLRSASDVEAAEAQLAAIAGRLPSPQLEAERAAAHAELMRWRSAAAGGAWDCMADGDAAKILLCLFGKAFLA